MLNEEKDLEKDLGEKDLEKELREKVLYQVKEYYDKIYKHKAPWKEGDRIPYAERCFDQDEMINLAEANLDFWLTSGRFCAEFEENFCKFLGVKYCALTNSGSSANLLAFMALTSEKLGDKRINPGDEVITVAAGFPTTVSPIIQYGAIPVFVDVNLETANINIEELEKAISPKTKAVILAHTLGNPFDLQGVWSFCRKYNLWLIEDNCDSLGAKAVVNGKTYYTGTVGHIGTSSFYPPHHMTMGEGGALYTNDPFLHKIIVSFRDWGRDCYCNSGYDNSCRRRFLTKYGELPFGYDHKYVYSHFGYNLKATEMQGAIGCAQLKKLPTFIQKRNENYNKLRDSLKDLGNYLLLPKITNNTEPSAFGLLLTIIDPTFQRRDLVEYLENHGIQTRLLFAGNIIKQPLFNSIRGNEMKYRVIGTLKNTDIIMNSSFFLGVYPKINDEMINYISTTIHRFFKEF